ncbi:MAG: hypothetical protein D4R73_07595 [Deltaproteobacteria bacterium]|nr:MAG: hypothetical protein D4R73_07595 [Deltaproteobacteria bacterium]
MKRFFQKALSVVIIFALCSGCATTTRTAPGASSDSTGNDAGTTADASSDSTGNDATKTKVQGAGLGALILGGIGAAVGAVIAGNTGAAIGGAAGAALGGLGGYMVGSAVASRKKKYANEEDRLNDEVKIAAQDNNELSDYNTQTLARIKTLDCEISELKQQYGQEKAQISDMEGKQEEIKLLIGEADKHKTKMTNELSALNEYLQSIKQTQQQTNVAKLEQEVSELKTNIEMLDSNNKQMAQMAESLTVRK